MHGIGVNCIVPAAPRVLQIGMLWGQDGTAGGLDRIYTDLVRMLPSAGIDVTGAVWGPDDVLRRSSGRVHSFAPEEASQLRRYLGVRRIVRRLVREEKVDLIASHFPLYAGLVLDELRGRPLVMHFHGPWYAEGAEEGGGRFGVRCKRWIEQQVYSRADRVIVLSRAFGELVTRDYGIASDRIRVVPGHVDLARFSVTCSRDAARARLNWPADRRIFVSVRRLTRRMGLEQLIGAMTQVAAAVPEVLLYIAGRGPMEAPLRQRVADAGLDRHVRFLGFVPDDDLPWVYRAADLNVVPSSRLEGFGLVVVEALASGTPSMVTPVGGLPEVTAPLSADMIFGGTSEADIATGLIAALRGRIRLPSAADCREYAAAHYGVPVAVTRIAGIYRELVG